MKRYLSHESLSLKIADLKFNSNLPEANELTLCDIAFGPNQNQWWLTLSKTVNNLSKQTNEK